MNFPAIFGGRETCKILYAIIFCLGITDLALKSLAWHHPSSDIFMNNRLYYKNPRNAPSDLCPRDEAQAQLQGRTCLRKCTSDEDCKSKRKKCFCDGACGFSCIKPERECEDPQPPSELGEVHITGKIFGSKAVYSCPEGYKVIGMEERVCQADGTWSGTPPACKKNIFCKQPPVIEHARHNAPIDQTTFDLDTSLQYQCASGYIIKGFARTKCFFYNGTSKWFGPDITCEPRTCVQPTDILNGRREGICLHFSCKVTYVCQPGFELVGKANHHCQADGTWTPKELPTCVPVQCSLPVNIENGKAVFTSVSFNSVVTYECKYGYMLVGEGSRRCGPNKRWSGVEPVCKEINCGSPGIVFGGWIEGSRTTLHAVILFHCVEGMTFEGSSDRTVCQSDGLWSSHSSGSVLPKCLAPCTIPSVAFGNVTTPKEDVEPAGNSTIEKEVDVLQPGTAVPHGKFIGVQCEKKYEAAYNITPSTCNNGTWTHAPKCQPAYCKYPGSIDNGRVLLVGNMGLYDYRNYVTKVANNRQIMFECDRGYILADGPQGKTCIRGEWAPKTDPPRCDPSQHPSFRWFRSVRKKRRAIKTGSSIVRNKPGGGGGGGGAPRRTNKKNRKPGEEDEYEFAPPVCENLDHDQYIQTQVIKVGKAENETFSAGAIVKVSCTQGFGVNLPNETVECVDGKWKPKIPQCSALPCKVPYIIHGTFYNGSKALVFLEPVKHTKMVEFRCSRGYILRGPRSPHCWYGEWDVSEAPECLPDGDQDHYGGDGRGDRKKKPGKDSGSRGIYPNNKRSCGSPPKEKGAIAYLEGKPIDYETEFSFADSTEVFYRCAPVKPRSKNRWKMRCEEGTWNGNALQCEGATNPEMVIQEIMKMINSSCIYRKEEKHVVTFFHDRELTSDYLEFPSNTLLISRCIDIGKFKLQGSAQRKCISGQWLGVTPKCEGLSQYHDYALDKSPTILFRYSSGSIVQSNDGKLVVYPGTTLHMECLWIRKFGTPKWEISNSNRTYQEGWTEAEGRDSTLEYRLTISDAHLNDSGTYSCVTPARHGHQINIIVKSVECKPLPEHPDLEYFSNNTHLGLNHTILGTNVTFICRSGNALVGAQSIVCSASGNWSAPLPKCENIECADISLLPAMAPLEYTSVTKNGTLKRNETAPPKISVMSRAVGGKATFICNQGYIVQGASEAVCQSNGEWSSAMPLCKEVECQSPQPPDNGYVSGSAPYKAGDLAQFECNQGYMMEGQPIVACQDSGTWSRSSAIKCVHACTYPGTIIGGTISQVKFYYSIGETVTFDCTDGNQLHGARMLHCIKNGKWSTTVPTCTAHHKENLISGLTKNVKSRS